MRRREFLSFFCAAGAATSPLVADAQQAERPRRIGFLRVGPPPAAFIGGFQKGLREQGLVEGRHFVIDYAIAKNSAEVIKAAKESVDQKANIIIASGTPSVMPARDGRGKCRWRVGDPRSGRNRVVASLGQAGPQCHRNDKYQRRPYCQATGANQRTAASGLDSRNPGARGEPNRSSVREGIAGCRPKSRHRAK